MKKLLLRIIASISIVLTGCNTNAGTVDISINELSAEITEVTNEVVHMNNCGGKGDVSQTAERSKSINVEFSGALSRTLGTEMALINQEVSAKYSEVNSSAKKIELVAPAGTNMEFSLKWTEKTWLGVVLVQGKDEQGKYKVSVPISIDLVNSQDLGCSTSHVTPPMDNNLLFAEDFEDYDLKDSWTDGEGKWSFVLDESGNVVYDIENSSSVFAGYNFGAISWQNYSIVYRARLLKDGEDAPLNLDFRLTNNDNSYTLMISPENSQVIKFVNSKISGLDYISSYFSPTVWHTIKLEVFNTNIRVYIDDQIVHSITDSSLSHGRLAFTIGPGTHAQFDDIKVTSIGN